MPRTQSRARDFDPVFDRLAEVTGFGSNPGALRMFKYVPADPQPALVVVLHGCTQTAASYDFGAGWSTLADRHGFLLLLPEHKTASTGFLPVTSGAGKAKQCRSAKWSRK
jgi:poly(3-hydroxybutyrate) depolymerase